MNIEDLWLKSHWVLKVFMLESLRNRWFRKGFDMRARMWPAWCYLIGIRATGARERTAWPPGTGMLNHIGFPMNPQERARDETCRLLLKLKLRFIKNIVQIAATTSNEGLEGFRHARAYGPHGII